MKRDKKGRLESKMTQFSVRQLWLTDLSTQLGNSVHSQNVIHIWWFLRHIPIFNWAFLLELNEYTRVADILHSWADESFILHSLIWSTVLCGYPLQLENAWFVLNFVQHICKKCVSETLTCLTFSPEPSSLWKWKFEICCNFSCFLPSS